MEYRKENNGWHTLLDQFFFPLGPAAFVVGWVILLFFQNLTGMPWIHFLEATAALLFSGAGLILYAKFPLYRSGRFFTFGIRSIPQGFKGAYRWGWRIFLFGVALSVCLLLSKQ
jgi:hypothetical protein